MASELASGDAEPNPPALIARTGTSLIPTIGSTTLAVPAPVAAAGERAAKRYVEFFTAQIRNPNTRAAYARAPAASSPGARRSA